MNQLNSIILEGNLVRDVVLSEPVSGFKVAKATIGVNRSYRNRNNEFTNEVSFFDVDCYGNAAEYFSSNGTKGRGIRVVGRLKQDTWKDSDGKSHSRIYVVAEHIEYKPAFKADVPQKEQNENSVEITDEQSVEMCF